MPDTAVSRKRQILGRRGCDQLTAPPAGGRAAVAARLACPARVEDGPPECATLQDVRIGRAMLWPAARNIDGDARSASA
jgi:hypothetical protein